MGGNFFRIPKKDALMKASLLKDALERINVLGQKIQNIQ